ncbi:MAG: transposase [Blastocatellia bacterium]|nr:transposase [Blastocatellia bacterium]
MPLEISARDLDDKMLWQILCHTSVEQGYIEGSCRVLNDAPSGNTVRAHLIKALGDGDQALEQLEEQLNQALQAQLPKRIRRKLRSRAWEAAGDWVDIPYHGKDGAEDKNVRPNQPKAGTTHFHAYATLSVISKGKRVTLAMTLVHKGEKMDQIVKRLMARARQLGARFKCTYWDKAFGAVEVMRYLRACRVPYVIALAQHGANGIRRLCVGRRSLRARYAFNTKKKTAPYETDVAIACHYAGRISKRRPKKKKKGVRYYAYAVYRVGQRSAAAVSAAYRRRFSIESGYRQLHQVRARTRSRHTGLRLLLIGLALLLVNLYALVRVRWAIVTRYGSRIYRRAVTLNEVATALLVQIQSLLGFSPEFYCRARGPGSRFIS